MRVIPIISIYDKYVVKTESYGKYTYVGNALNTVRIFSDFGVDELLINDIGRSKGNVGRIDFSFYEKLFKHCRVPVGFGGGINSIALAKSIVNLGVEKIVINSANFQNETLIREISSILGSQAVVGCIDYRGDDNFVYRNSGKARESFALDDWAVELENRGCGEILLSNILMDGTRKGLDLVNYMRISNIIKLPIILSGGFSGFSDLENQLQSINVKPPSAIGVGHYFMFKSKETDTILHYARK